MRVYEAIVKGLEGIGVDAAFGGAGENAAGMMLALEESKKIRPVITRNEQAASFMACGYAMFTDRLGVCFATAGPGAFNMISGMSMALTDSYPLLAISGYSSMKWTGKGSLNETSGVGRTPDSEAMFAATTKRSILLKELADTCDVLEEAVNLAFEGRPGPVHVAVAEDLTDPDLSVDYRDIRLEVKPVRPDADRIEQAAAAIAEAVNGGRQVVVLAGFGAIRSRAGDALRRIVEHLQIPVLTTLDGKGIIPENHPLAVGVFADSGHKSAWKTFLNADLVIAVGNSFAQHATFDFREDLFHGRSLVHINIDPGEIDKVYPAEHGIVSDATLALEALGERLRALVDPVGSRSYESQDYESEHILSILRRLHPGELAQTVSRLLPEGGFVLADAGAHLAWLGYYLELSGDQHFRKPGTYGPMAGHVNGALGLKYAHPDRTVVAACGDGCYLMSGFELMTAVEYDIPVIWVIFNDGEFKLIKLYQLAAYQESGLTDFMNPDYAAYARACGADGYRVETLDEFEQAFRAALASGKPTLIDAAISRLALPNYSPSPEGILHGMWESFSGRFGAGRGNADE